jgi:hypothetical protein
MLVAALVYLEVKAIRPRGRRRGRTVRNTTLTWRQRRMIRFLTRGLRLKSLAECRSVVIWLTDAETTFHGFTRLVRRACGAMKDVERVAPQGASVLHFTPAPKPCAADTS